MEVIATTSLTVNLSKVEMIKVAKEVLIKTLDKNQFPWLKNYYYDNLYLDDKNELFKREEWCGHNREVDYIPIKKLNEQEVLVFNIIKNLEKY